MKAVPYELGDFSEASTKTDTLKGGICSPYDRPLPPFFLTSRWKTRVKLQRDLMGNFDLIKGERNYLPKDPQDLGNVYFLVLGEQAWNSVLRMPNQSG